MQHYPAAESQGSVRHQKVGITGTGAADATKRYGQGTTCVRQGVGVHRLTFAENLGVFMGPSGAVFSATVMTALGGFTVVFGDYTAATRTVDFTIMNAANAAADLAAAQKLDLVIDFCQVPLLV